MLRIWCFGLLMVTLWHEVASGAMGGDFYASIDKIDNMPELNRDYADWHLFVRRINKNDKILDGHYVVKKDIVGPKAVLTSYILSNNKYYKMAVNELIPTNLCSQNIKKTFITPYFDGNSSFAEPPDCVIRPGVMKLKPGQNRNFDYLAHQVMTKSIYGTYKLVGKIMNKDNRVVGGATWIVTIKKKE